MMSHNLNTLNSVQNNSMPAGAKAPWSKPMVVNLDLEKTMAPGTSDSDGEAGS